MEEWIKFIAPLIGIAVWVETHYINGDQSGSNSSEDRSQG